MFCKISLPLEEIMFSDLACPSSIFWFSSDGTSDYTLLSGSASSACFSRSSTSSKTTWVLSICKLSCLRSKVPAFYTTVKLIILRALYGVSDAYLRCFAPRTDAPIGDILERSTLTLCGCSTIVLCLWCFTLLNGGTWVYYVDFMLELWRSALFLFDVYIVFM